MSPIKKDLMERLKSKGFGPGCSFQAAEKRHSLLIDEKAFDA